MSGEQEATLSSGRSQLVASWPSLTRSPSFSRGAIARHTRVSEQHIHPPWPQRTSSSTRATTSETRPHPRTSPSRSTTPSQRSTTRRSAQRNSQNVRRSPPLSITRRRVCVSLTSRPLAPRPTVQDKYGKDFQLGDDDEDDETDYSTDDDDAELVTPEVDAAILRTLAKIRAKDPSVYDDGRNVFEGAPTSLDHCVLPKSADARPHRRRGRSRDRRRTRVRQLVQGLSRQGLVLVQARPPQGLPARAPPRQPRRRRSARRCRGRWGRPADSRRGAARAQARDHRRVPPGWGVVGRGGGWRRERGRGRVVPPEGEGRRRAREGGARV